MPWATPPRIWPSTMAGLTGRRSPRRRRTARSSTRPVSTSTSTMRQWVPPDHPLSPPSYSCGHLELACRRRRGGARGSCATMRASSASVRARRGPRTLIDALDDLEVVRRSPRAPRRRARGPSPAARGEPWSTAPLAMRRGPAAAGAHQRHGRDVGVAEDDVDVVERARRARRRRPGRASVSWPWPCGCWRVTMTIVPSSPTDTVRDLLAHDHRGHVRPRPGILEPGAASEVRRPCRCRGSDPPSQRLAPGGARKPSHADQARGLLHLLTGS